MSAEPPRLLVCIDPGLPDCGVAIYDRGELVRAEWCKASSALAQRAVTCPILACRGGVCVHMDQAAAIEALCDAVEDVISAHSDKGRVSAAVSEWPQIFHNKGKLQGTTVQQVLDLAAVVGVLLDRLVSWGAVCQRYTPQQWKGNDPKPDHQRLGLCLLSPQERELLPKSRTGVYRSDPLDAALLGQWWLSRQGMRPELSWGQPWEFKGKVER